MRTTFYQLPLGARFEFRGKRYEKLALSMAGDEERCGSFFQDEAEVVWDRQPGEELKPPRPPEPAWWSYMSRAPGQREMRNAECGVRNEQRQVGPAVSAGGGEGAGSKEQEDSWK